MGAFLALVFHPEIEKCVQTCSGNTSVVKVLCEQASSWRQAPAPRMPAHKNLLRLGRRWHRPGFISTGATCADERCPFARRDQAPVPASWGSNNIPRWPPFPPTQSRPSYPVPAARPEGGPAAVSLPLFPGWAEPELGGSWAGLLLGWVLFPDQGSAGRIPRWAGRGFPG